MTLTKGELRRARKEARAQGLPLNGELAIRNHDETPRPWDEKRMRTRRRTVQVQPKSASRTEQAARYLDCGPAAWDDR